MTRRATLFLAVSLAGTAAPALADGIVLLVADRQNNSVWMLRDANFDGVIVNNGFEMNVWFGPANLAGIGGGILNSTCLGYRPSDGLCLVGDQSSGETFPSPGGIAYPTARKVYWLRDNNNDGNAQGSGEAGVFADITTVLGQSFAFPTGVAFDGDGVAYVVNAGNGFGPDAVWRCADPNGDDDAMDPGETTHYATTATVAGPPIALGLGQGNSTIWGPQEIVFDHSGALYLRNSITNNFQTFRLVDADHSGAVTDAEVAVFFGPGNADGVTPATGFALDMDLVRPRSFYFHQTTSGSVDSIYRISDSNDDGDTQDSGEVTLVFSTGESGFTIIDLAALADGSLLVTDNSGKRIVRLRDLDSDGDFMDAGERTDLMDGTVFSGDVRQIIVVHQEGCSDADLGRQGGLPGGDDLLDNNDFVVFIDLFFAAAPLADIGRQGGLFGYDGLFDNNDFVVFIDRFFAGCLW